MPARTIWSRKTLQWTSLIAGPLLAAVTYASLPHTYLDSTRSAVEFTHAGRVTCALAAWMAVWWMTEAISIYLTALLPLAVLPLFRAASTQSAAASYANELIFLFMGGFILAQSMERWGLHKRIAFGALRLVGTKPHRVVLGFMIATAFISLWVSNTATAIMMLPIALSVIDLVLRQTTGKTVEETRTFTGEKGHNFAVCLLLGIAYSASIGGVGTLIGTPPNLFLASYIQNELGREVSFVRWMAVGIPFVVLFIPITWVLLTRVLYPIRLSEIEGGSAFVHDGYRELGRMKRGEWVTLVVFSLAASAWVFRPLLAKMSIGSAQPFAGLTDSGVAMIAAVILFVTPADVKARRFVMDWEGVVKVPWGVLLLFGGGLSLAAAIEKNGVGELIASQVAGFAGFPQVVLVLIVTTILVFVTELASNTATTATFVPILAAVAPGLGASPYMLIMPATIAASCGFMLPAGTPPNALVFGSGYIRIGQMIKAGIWLDMIGIVLITALTYLLVIPLFVH